ncbi:MAG TPA: MOSC N-terminal beta barrel domain-containing protein [Burkholderiales bacterium]|nr:MOSC N-terminal beta barrel domain-containing protein [Burkholderiales bacterium]
MKRVAALYRYPVKGFGPERCEALEVLPHGGVAGDRVLGFRFADAATPDDAWGSKFEFVALVNTPALARLDLKLSNGKLRIADLVEDDLSAEGRKRIAAALQEYVLDLDVNPLADHPERLPIRLVGDGVTPRYQDRNTDELTLHGRASLAAAAASAGTPELDEVRFRSNVAVEGLDAWAEQRWDGKRVFIGGVAFRFERPKGRCLATHANPRTGERDLPLMQTLLAAYRSEKPTFAISLRAQGQGGTIRLGDEVRIE